jgi:hypothetical protein
MIDKAIFSKVVYAPFSGFHKSLVGWHFRHGFTAVVMFNSMGSSDSNGPCQFGAVTLLSDFPSPSLQSS